MEVSLMEMLEAREKRAWRQRELLKRGRTVICFTMNIAGPIKNSPLIGSGYDLGKRLLLGQLDVAGVAVSDFEEVREKTGNECILLVDAEPLAVKAITAELEDGTTFIVYRGTDSTLIGWREDFNMSFETPVPAQTAALEYLIAQAARSDREILQRTNASVISKACSPVSG